MSRTRFILLAALVAVTTARADVKPHALFSDHMVLQQGVPIPVWGTADPGADVQVRLEINTPGGSMANVAEAKADKDGKWMAKLRAFPAGTGGELSVWTDAKKMTTFKDVAVGEVWVASGQSNMEWTLAMTPKGGGTEAIANSANPNLRVFTVPKYAVPAPSAGFNPKPPNDKYSKWLPSHPDNAAMFTAVGYYFGKDLQAALNVPVGIIHTSWGGTPAQAWTSTEVLAAEPELKHYVEGLEARKKAWDPNKAKADHDAAMERWRAAVAKAKENKGKDGKVNLPRQPQMPAQPGTGSHDAASLYNGMIAPLLPYAVKGAIWYQGESNAGQPIEYRTLYAAMIQDWRKRWGTDLPFFCVQLAPFNSGDPNGQNWAYLREAQEIASKKVGNAGVAVITDAGDLTDIHPQKKGPAGSRLALLALAKVYGRRVVSSGPTVASVVIKGNQVVIRFDNTAGGLSVAQFSMPGAEDVGKDGKLVGFTIAGKDQKFQPATAIIHGDEVIVTSAEVPEPVAVRYGWVNFPVANLGNKAGLPASPFRTDNFDPPFKK